MVVVSCLYSVAGHEEFCTDHFDFGIVVPHLPNLEEFDITYRVRNCGMNFEWSLFLFTLEDCKRLTDCLSSCKTLRKLKIHQSKVNSARCKMIAEAFMHHPSLEELDLSNNLIKDHGAKALARLISEESRLKKLTLLHNNIRDKGTQAIAEALQTNNTLVSLNLRLNMVGDTGGSALFTALAGNSALKDLNLGSNEMGHEVAPSLKQLVESNSTLQVLDLSCTKIGPVGGATIQVIDVLFSTYTLCLDVGQEGPKPSCNLLVHLKLPRFKTTQHFTQHQKFHKPSCFLFPHIKHCIYHTLSLLNTSLNPSKICVFKYLIKPE